MTDASKHVLRVAMEQCAPGLGSVVANRAMIRSALRELSPGADLVVFPELTLTGYDVRHSAHELAVPVEALGLESMGIDNEGIGDAAAVLGFIERDADGRVYNSALAADAGGLIHCHRKCYLPTYGMFDEGRYFAPSRRAPRAFDLPGGWRAGILICEDLWHPSMSYLLALQRIDLLIVVVAAAGRGRTEGDSGEVRYASSETWELIARSTALTHGMFVVMVNRVGNEGEIEFAGGSAVIGPDGTVVAQARQGEAARVEVSLDREAVIRQRAVFSHLRDEDPALTYFGLQQLLAEEQSGDPPRRSGSPD